MSEARSDNAGERLPLGMTREEERVVAAILSALRRIQHGSVQLVVQDRRVVQIDTVEKTRLPR